MKHKEQYKKVRNYEKKEKEKQKKNLRTVLDFVLIFLCGSGHHLFLYFIESNNKIFYSFRQ